MSHGYALRRNGSCEATEVNCGSTGATFHACCPEQTYCPPNQETTICWKSSTDQDVKRCADSSWDLYYAENFFCCDHGLTGFIRDNRTGFVGCADPGYEFGERQVPLSIVASGTVSSTTTTTTTASSTGTSATETPTPTEPSTHSEGESHTNTGAIAGGVVGGVAGLAIIILAIWLILGRRRKQAKPQRLADTPTPGQETQELEAQNTPGPEIQELESENAGLADRVKPYRQDLPPGQQPKEAQELWGKTEDRPVAELPAVVPSREEQDLK